MGWIDEDGRPVSKSKGKALRPTLCLLSSVASGGTIQSALPAAVALELIHNFSLIHDDIEDNDTERYGEKTLHEEHGLSVALNAGDLLIGEGYRLIGESTASAGQRAAMLQAAATGQRTRLSLSEICGKNKQLNWRNRHIRENTSVLATVYQA